mgnify:CR=1 FL=1
MAALKTSQEQDLAKVPPQLWAKGPYDVGLINTAKPVKITLREGAILASAHQYPLSKEADEGIAPTIQALIDQGILYIRGRSGPDLWGMACPYFFILTKTVPLLLVKRQLSGQLRCLS